MAWGTGTAVSRLSVKDLMNWNLVLQSLRQSSFYLEIVSLPSSAIDCKLSRYWGIQSVNRAYW
jgi:hypothetical protein